jgi:hypothetical protein
MRISGAQQLNYAGFGMRRRIEKCRNCIVCTVSADRTDRQAGQAAFATLSIEYRRLAGRNRIHRA